MNTQIAVLLMVLMVVFGITGYTVGVAFQPEPEPEELSNFEIANLLETTDKLSVFIDICENHGDRLTRSYIDSVAIWCIIDNDFKLIPFEVEK